MYCIPLKTVIFLWIIFPVVAPIYYGLYPCEMELRIPRNSQKAGTSFRKGRVMVHSRELGGGGGVLRISSDWDDQRSWAPVKGFFGV